MASDVAIKLDLELDLSKIRQQGQEIGNILERSLNKNTRMQALDRLERQIERTREKVRTIQSDLQKAMTTQVPTKSFKALEDAAADVHKELDVIVRDFAKNSGLSFEEAGKALRKSFDTGVFKAGMIKWEDIDKLADIYGKLDAITKKQDELRSKGKASFIDENAVKRLQQQLGTTSDQMHELILRYRELSMQSGNSIQNALQPMINFNQEISQTIGAISQAFGPYIQIAQGAMQGLVKVTEMEVKALKTMGVVAISAFKPLVSLAEGAASAISKIFSSIKKHNETTMKNLWRNVLRYGIGVRSMYFLVRKIRAVIGDVINELSKQIPEVNAQMSAFKTALNGLKGALGTAFQPILSAVLPALTTLINAVSKAITVVGKFIALLTGQNFVYEATATQVNYAESLKKTGSAAKKAKKELEGYLSPIDEINKYQSEKDDEDSGSGGSGDGGGDFTMKKVPIEDWIKDFWDKIRKMWQDADFFDLGKMLGDKLAEMLANIPWDKIKNNARKLGKSLATFLNGIMYGEFDGKSLATYVGETIAQALNTAFEFVNSFVKNFDWNKLGQSIIDTIKGFFETLDWNVITETLGNLGKGLGETVARVFQDPVMFKEAGDALGRAVNALVDMVYNFFNQQSGANIGLAIANFINGAVNRFDPKDFSATCNKIMEVLLDSLISAVRNTKWDQVGEKLAELINGIDFKTIFSKYTKLANSIIDAILDTLRNFLDGLDQNKIKEIGESVADCINNIDFQPKELGTVANDLLEALLDIILETVGNIDWDKIGSEVRTMLEQIDWIALIAKSIAIKNSIELGLIQLFVAAVLGIRDSIAEKFKELGKNIVKGVIEGMQEENPILRILKIFAKIVLAVMEFLGIHSPSTVFMEIGQNIVDGFIDGLKSIVDKAKEIWEKLKTEAIEKFEAIKEKVKEKTTALKDKVIEIYEDIKTKVQNKVTALKEKVVEIYENIKEEVQEKITNLKEKVVEIYENIKEEVVEKVEALKENVVELYETIKTNIEEKVEVIKERVVELYEDIKEEVTEKVEELKEKVVDKYEEIKTEITDKVDGIKTTVEDTWTDMKESTIDIFEDMWTGIKKVINSILAGIEAFVNGIITGFNKAIEAINTLAFDIPDWVPEVGGNTIGFSIPTLHKVSIPRLAQGSVIPPNKEFMAVLGDQKSGTNIETPLSTMVEAFNTALRQSGNVGGVKQINFLLPDRRTLASYTIEGGRIIQTSTGRNPFELA